MQTRHIFFEARTKELREYDISVIQATALFVVETLGEKATIGEIARWLIRQPNTVSEIIKRMEVKGLVIKFPDPERKRVMVELTERGIEACHQSKKRESVYKIMSCLSQEERQQLKLTLTKLRDRARKEIVAESTPPFPK